MPPIKNLFSLHLPFEHRPSLTASCVSLVWFPKWLFRDTKPTGISPNFTIEAIAHHSVEPHPGSIKAESAGEGQGTAFILKLPLLKLDAQPV